MPSVTSIAPSHTKKTIDNMNSHVAPANTSPASSSSFPSETDYLEKSLSVWLGECHDSGRNSNVAIELSPLDIWTAASIGHYDFVKRIVENEIISSSNYCSSSSSSDSAICNDLNARNKGGWTPLMYAAFIGHDDIVNLLLAQESVDVNVRCCTSGHREVTALMLAASCGNESISTALLNRGADVNARNKEGWTALFHATNGNHANLVKLLLRSGASLDCSEPKHGYTPFMLAAGEGLEIIVQSFLDCCSPAVDEARLKSFVNAKNRCGDTARSIAYQRGHTKIISLIDDFLYRANNGSPNNAAMDNQGGRPGYLNNNGAQSNTQSGKTPSILDGPEAFERLVINNNGHKPGNNHKPGSDGSSTCSNNLKTVSSSSQRSSNSHKPGPLQKVRDSSPRDSRGADSPDQDADDDPFGNTAAVTIRSNGSSSKGLAAALGIVPGGGGGGGGGRGDRDVGGTAPGIIIANQDPKSQWPDESNPSHLPPSQPRLHHQHPKPPPRPKMDLATLLTSLGLQKYISVFDELEVDLPVFLTLTDNDLRECGITLFGPRRKMTSAIARYHSYASISQSRAAKDTAAAAGGGGGSATTDNVSQNGANYEMSWIESLDWTSNPLEKAYADKLEVEMQEMAIRLHQAGRQVEALEANFQQIQNFLYDLHKSMSDSRKLSRSAARRTNELEQALTQQQQQQQQQQQMLMQQQHLDPASLIPSLLQFHVELESLTSMQRNGIEDLLRKFNRGKSGNANAAS